MESSARTNQPMTGVRKRGSFAMNDTGLVRSSATAEDLPESSFAGQQETFLNIRGEADLIDAVKKCWASLWTARAIAYRIKNDIDQNAVALAVGEQVFISQHIGDLETEPVR